MHCYQAQLSCSLLPPQSVFNLRMLSRKVKSCLSMQSFLGGECTWIWVSVQDFGIRDSNLAFAGKMKVGYIVEDRTKHAGSSVCVYMRIFWSTPHANTCLPKNPITLTSLESSQPQRQRNTYRNSTRRYSNNTHKNDSLNASEFLRQWRSLLYPLCKRRRAKGGAHDVTTIWAKHVV